MFFLKNHSETDQTQVVFPYLGRRIAGRLQLERWAQNRPWLKSLVA